MNVLPLQLITGTLPSGNAEGVNTLLGGGLNVANSAEASTGQSFLDVFAALTTTQGGQVATNVQPSQPADGQILPVVDNTVSTEDALAAAYAQLANILSPQGTDNNTVLPDALSNQVATQAQTDTNQTGANTAPVTPVQIAAVIPPAFVPELQPMQTPDVTMLTSAPVAPDQVSSPITEISNATVVQQTSTNTQILTNIPNDINTLPESVAVQKDGSQNQAVVSPTEGEILLPTSFIATGQDEQAIVTLPSNLKISDLASQKTFNDTNTDVPNTQNNAAVLVNAVKSDTAASIPQTVQDITIAAADISDNTADTATDQLLQTNVLLGNKLYKKAEDTLQQKTQMFSNIMQNAVSQSSVPDSAGDAIVIKFQKTAANTSVTLPADGNDITTVNNAAVADKNSLTLTTANTIAQATPGVAGATQTNEASTAAKQAFAQATPVEQITVKVAHALKDDAKKITIHLEPASLGKVDIRMELAHDGKAHISILVDKPETMELLQRDAKQLQNALNDAGVKADAGSLNFSMRGGGDQQGKYGNQQGFQHYSNNQSSTKSEDTLLSEIQAYVGNAQVMQGVDIRV